MMPNQARGVNAGKGIRFVSQGGCFQGPEGRWNVATGGGCPSNRNPWWPQYANGPAPAGRRRISIRLRFVRVARFMCCRFQTKVTPAAVPSATDPERKSIWPKRLMNCIALRAHTRLRAVVTREWLFLNKISCAPSWARANGFGSTGCARRLAPPVATIQRPIRGENDVPLGLPWLPC
jgi:hypothetical protein